MTFSSIKNTLSSIPLHGWLFSRKEKSNIRLSIKIRKRGCGGEGRAAGRGAGEARVAVVWQGGNSSTLGVSVSGEGREGGIAQDSLT